MMLAQTLFKKPPLGVVQSPRASIWILEDDYHCLFVYRDILERGYDLKTFKSLASFSEHLEEYPNEKPDLIIADLHLKDGSFLDTLNEKILSRRKITAPLMVVSVRDEVSILEDCFNNGAMDYLVKPFNKNELVCKVTRLLKKKPQHEFFDEIKIDSLNMTVSRFGIKSDKLTLKEMQLLSFFLEGPDCKQSRKNLIRVLWSKSAVSPQVLNVHLKNLRAKINNIGLFITFNGAHYVLEKKDLAERIG